MGRHSIWFWGGGRQVPLGYRIGAFGLQCPCCIYTMTFWRPMECARFFILVPLSIHFLYSSTLSNGTVNYFNVSFIDTPPTFFLFLAIDHIRLGRMNICFYLYDYVYTILTGELLLLLSDLGNYNELTVQSVCCLGMERTCKCPLSRLSFGC